MVEKYSDHILAKSMEKNRLTVRFSAHSRPDRVRLLVLKNCLS